VSDLIASMSARLFVLRQEGGQTFVEYALVLVLIAVATAVIVQTTNLASAIGNALQTVVDEL
jgi:Flp pilus assembly pilin Flp